MIDFIQCQVKVIPKLMLCPFHLSFPKCRFGLFGNTGQGDWKRFTDAVLGTKRSEDGDSLSVLSQHLIKEKAAWH